MVGHSAAIAITVASSAVNVSPAALILIVFPNAVVLVCLNVTRHFHQFHRNTHLRIIRVHGQGGALRWASRPKTKVESSQAVLATRPLAQRETTCLIEVRCTFDVVAIRGAVQPFAGILTILGFAVGILDGNSIGGIDRPARRTVLVFTELKLAVALVHALGARIVIAIVVETQTTAIFSDKQVAFSWLCVPASQHDGCDFFFLF